MGEVTPAEQPTDGRKPAWLKKPLPDARHKSRMESLLRQRGLHTVCESASCPNLGRCFEHGTATFLIMGDVCTRSCRFCGVASGRPLDLDPDEPGQVADAASVLGLGHVVVTSVTRDDLPDGGASHYAQTIRAVRKRCPGSTVEVLVPDFGGRWDSLETVLAEAPEVMNHNVETVPRLYESVRPLAVYSRSLELLRRSAADGRCAVKAGLMVGLGETEAEVEGVMNDVAEAGVSIVTVGQYLRPRRECLSVSEYVRLEVFERYERMGSALGLLVHAAPFVRSSFDAGESLALANERRRKSERGKLQ